jgi:ADP-heptose:LPS heptosyltransferase
VRTLLRDGRYLVNDPLPRWGLRAVDAVLDRWPSRTASTPASVAPRRVLLALGGHMGDAIIATSAVAAVRILAPQTEIGVVVGSWMLAAIEGLPDVGLVHVVDHWKSNRTEPTLAGRARRYATSWRRAVREIRDAHYDVAIDLYPYFPNSATLLLAAGVPRRVGYTSAGFGGLYTDPVPYVDDLLHVAEQHGRLIARALGREPLAAPPPVRLPEVPSDVHDRARAILAAAGVDGDDYLVAHMAAATPQREWRGDRWRATLARFAGDGHRIVCTGLAGREADLAASITAGLPGSVNLCGQLTWDELMAVISRATVVLSVDTAIAHAAAALDVPTVTLMASIARPEHWRPLARRGTALVNPMPCAPCFVRAGCAHMSCVRDIAVQDVIDAVERELRAAVRH